MYQTVRFPIRMSPRRRCFLPEYDNAVLSHGDRTRYTPDDAPRPPADVRILGSVLDDGFLWATWSLQRAEDAVTMVIRHLGGSKRRIAAIGAEGERALAFLEPGARVRDIHFVPAE